MTNPHSSKIFTLFNNPLHSDLTILTSTSTSFHVHLNILSIFTPFFSAATAPSSGFLEFANKTVELPKHPPEAVKAFLKFCYKGFYDHSAPFEQRAEIDVAVYRLAGYLMVEDVKTSAVEHFAEDVVGCMSWFEHAEMAGVVEDLWGGEGCEELKEIVLKAVVEGFGKGWGKEPIEELGKTYPEFAMGLVGKLAASWGGRGSGRRRSARTKTGPCLPSRVVFGIFVGLLLSGWMMELMRGR